MGTIASWFSKSDVAADIIFGVQAVITLLAIWVSICLARSELRRRRKALRAGIKLIAKRTSDLIDEISGSTLYCVAKTIAAPSAPRNIYVAMVKRRVAEIQAFLMTASIDHLADAEVLDAVMSLRQGMSELAGGFEYYEFDSLNGKPKNASEKQFGQAKQHVDKALQELDMHVPYSCKLCRHLRRMLCDGKHG